MEQPFTHTRDPFTFTYDNQEYSAFAECLHSSNSFKRYKLNFPNVGSIVEGSVYMTETLERDWEIEKIMRTDC